MIGDVKKAEKQLNELLTKPRTSELLDLTGMASEKSLTAENYIKKVKQKCASWGTKNLAILCINANKLAEIVRLLSTRPHTNSNSNFVKLVKNKVVRDDKLIMYLQGDDLDCGSKPVRDALMRYLKLTDKQADDDIPESEVEEDLRVQLKRKKNKNLLGKIKSRRLVDRLKALVVALFILTIDYASENMRNQEVDKQQRHDAERRAQDAERRAQDAERRAQDAERRAQDAERRAQDAEDRAKDADSKRQAAERVAQTAGRFTSARPETPEQKEQRWNEGRLTVDEFNNLSFGDAQKLTKVFIPKGVTVIKSAIFVASLGPLTFNEYKNETLKEVFVPESVKTIQANAFAHCLDLNLVTMADVSSLDIEYGAFQGCKGLRGINIPFGTKSIGNCAFCECNLLNSVTIPGSVNVIGAMAFLCCGCLNVVTIEEGVLKIGDRGFEKCKKLETIIVPKSLQSIGKDAFKDCPKNMNILGGAKESVKNIIRCQVGQPEVAIGAEE